MVGRLAAALLVVGLLLLVPGNLPAHPGQSAPPTAPSFLPPSGRPVTPSPLAPVDPLRGLLAHNLTGPAVAPSAGTPVSAYQETPAPPLPGTTPTVVTVVTNGRGCCYYENRTPAGGPWDAVVLNYTGTAVNGVYDSSYRAYVGGAEVLFGTTPEYGTWTVLDNITEYESLLEPGANFTFILSAALVGGYFETTVTLSFYPAPAGGPLPREPTKVVPLWSLQFVKPTSPAISVNASVPANTSAATLELWSYGFQSDEFWWASATPERAVDMTLDGSPFAAVYPFPYVNTGGVDLFLWRPIPAVFTLSDRPYHVNLTGALGGIEGAHTYGASIGGREANSDWLVEGSLLLYTNSTVGPATLTANGATLPSPTTSGSTQSSSTSFHYNSTIPVGSTSVSAATSVTGSFHETVTSVSAATNGTSWENVSQLSTMTDTTVAAGPNGTEYANSTRTFGMGTDLGSRFVVTSTTGGGYPVTGNGTTSMFAVEQQWTELNRLAGTSASGGRLGTTEAVDNEVTGANGVWTAVETIASSGASPSIVSITFVQSATPKYTTEADTGPSGTSAYSHLMTGSVYAPTNVNGAETILENLWETTPLPLASDVTATPDPVDVGGAVTIAAVAHGGAGVYSYAWSGLPAGCPSSAGPAVTCRPSAPGVSLAVVTVQDSAGDLAASAPATIVVSPPLNVSVVPSTRGADLGGPLSFSAAITGGTPPYACTWTLTGEFPTPGNCSGVPSAPSSAGPVNASVAVSDATGAVVNASSATVVVAKPLSLFLTREDNASAAHAGTPMTFSVAVTGGTPPIALSWIAGSTALVGYNGTSLNFTSAANGTLTVQVLAVDAAGGAARSNAVSVDVGPPVPGSGTGPGTSSAPSPYGATFWATVGLAALAVVEAVLLLATRRPPRPRPRTPPPAG